MAKKMYVGCPVVSATNLLGGQGEVSITGNASAVETYQNLSISPSLVQNHIYYFGVDISQDNLTAGAEFYWPIAEPKVMSETRASAINTWTRIGGVNSRTAWSSGTYSCRIDNNNHYTSATIKYKNFILIDLTATFGSGSEPDVTWCNENIGYFSGTGAIPDATGTVSPTARKVKSIYVGVNGVARKVKKGYVGVNGIAKLFFSLNPELSYYGTYSNLPEKLSRLAGVSIGDYALFGGATLVTSSSESVSNTTVAYNASLTMLTPTPLSVARTALGATVVGDYALFGGGATSLWSARSRVVDAYNTSLTRTTPTSMSYYTCILRATSINGVYALFSGGVGGSSSSANSLQSSVNAYNTSLTRTTPTSMSRARQQHCACANTNYALFGGGQISVSSATFTTDVDAYNASLTRSIPTALSMASYGLNGISFGEYALCGGGINTSGTGVSAVNAYDLSLTRSILTSLSVGRAWMGSACLGEYALFAGGFTTSTATTDAVDAYNASLTRSIPTSLSSARGDIGGASVGEYLVFAGGNQYAFAHTADVYTVS